MIPSDVRDAAIVLILASAPVALFLIVAVLRGYTIDLHMHREHRRRRDDGDR